MKTHRETAVVAVLGAVLGTWFIGLGNLAPASLGWLKKDAVLNQIAYEYFWRSSYFQFPLSATPNLGVGWGTGLHSNGENLIVALVFKPLASQFDHGFQFQGIWIVLCFSLHALAANRVFAELRLGLLARGLGTAFVTLSPSLIHRIASMNHFQLAAHWLLLVAFLMYLRRSRGTLWCLLLSFTLMTNVYLFVMVFCVWLASLTERTLRSISSKSPSRFRVASQELLCAVAAIAVSLAFAGFLSYLTSGQSVKGLELLRASPLTYLNPSESNLFFKVRIHFPHLGSRWANEDSEGFSYLGIGVLVLVPCFVIRSCRSRGAVIARFLPLAVALIALFLVSLSNRIAVGGREYVIAVPASLVDARQIFRSSPRFVWPLGYAVTIATWTMLARWVNSIPRSRRVVVLIVIFVAQMVDVIPYVVSQQRLLSADNATQTELVSGTWKSLLPHYDALYFVPTLDFFENHSDSTTEVQAWAESSRLRSAVQFSAANNLKINFAYVSRPVTGLVERANDVLQSQLETGELASGTIYLFATEELWGRYAPEHGSNAFVLDGYFVILGPPRCIQQGDIKPGEECD